MLLMTWRAIMAGPTETDGGPAAVSAPPVSRSSTLHAAAKGLTLVHFSAQRKRFLWDRGCG